VDFDTVEQLRHALIEFQDVYNATWLIERHGFRPPVAIRAEQLPSATRPRRLQQGVSATAGGTSTAFSRSSHTGRENFATGPCACELPGDEGSPGLISARRLRRGAGLTHRRARLSRTRPRLIRSRASRHRHARAIRSHAAWHAAPGQALRFLPIQLVSNIIARLASTPRRASPAHPLMHLAS
jgi:hypothetical protein